VSAYGVTAHGGGETPAVEVEGVSLRLSGSIVLDEVSFRLPRGEFLGILGPNGAGKTMLLRVLLGLVRPDTGRVRLLGLPIEEGRRLVGYVPQQASFPRDFPIRVRDVVLTGRLSRASLARRVSGDDRAAAARALETVRIADLADRQIGKLSGGQMQRVLIARALASDPHLLLLDEPTASLDQNAAGALYALLAEMRRTRTVVMVAHDVGVVTKHVTSVACMNRRLFLHDASEVSHEMIERTYGLEMGLVVHTHPHEGKVGDRDDRSGARGRRDDR
jgi:zinc transport system ATP-binding protein